MAFETGVATSISDLWTKLRTFAINSLGWTLLGNTGTAPISTYLTSVSGKKFGFGYYDTTSLANTIHTCTVTGYTDGVAMSAQPGTSYAGTKSTRTGAITFPLTAYWFFGGPDYLHFVVEDVPGEFWHGGVGVLDKTHAFTDGDYSTGTTWDMGSNLGQVVSTGHNLPFSPSCQSAATIGTLRVNGTITSMSSNTGTNSTGSLPFAVTSPYYPPYLYNDFVGRTLLFPIYVYSHLLRCIIGVPFNMATCGLKYFGGKGVVVLGADTWYLFPFRKYRDADNPSTAVMNSGPYGFAYRRVN
ncbi:MAG: hypothetical protein IPN62_16545 [Flavobacteriales bacterium]|nr:hypothetical protein [Flavobacteriales bacterium]